MQIRLFPSFDSFLEVCSNGISVGLLQIMNNRKYFSCLMILLVKTCIWGNNTCRQVRGYGGAVIRWGHFCGMVMEHCKMRMNFLYHFILLSWCFCVCFFTGCGWNYQYGMSGSLNGLVSMKNMLIQSLPWHHISTELITTEILDQY